MICYISAFEISKATEYISLEMPREHDENGELSFADDCPRVTIVIIDNCHAPADYDDVVIPDGKDWVITKQKDLSYVAYIRKFDEENIIRVLAEINHCRPDEICFDSEY